MKKDFCDVCKEEIRPGDLSKLNITRDINGVEKPIIREKELCVFCKEKIVKAITELTVE